MLCLRRAMTVGFLMLEELRKEKGGRSSSMVANLIVHAGDTASMALPLQSAAVSAGLRLRDGPAEYAATWKSSPESSSKRQSRSQQPAQVRSA